MADTVADGFWQERAATDPLGRTAEELRRQWAARTPLRAADSGGGIGYAAEAEEPPDVMTVVPSALLDAARAATEKGARP